jgi:hypothetical protein
MKNFSFRKILLRGRRKSRGEEGGVRKAPQTQRWQQRPACVMKSIVFYLPEQYIREENA